MKNNKPVSIWALATPTNWVHQIFYIKRYALDQLQEENIYRDKDNQLRLVKLVEEVKTNTKQEKK